MGYSTTILAVFLAPIFALFAIVSYSILRELGNAACVDRKARHFHTEGWHYFAIMMDPRHNQPAKLKASL